MKNIKTFETFINEGKVNEAFVGTVNADVLEKTLADFASNDDDSIDIPTLQKGYETIAKLLKGNLKTVASEMEEGEYELCKALAIGLDKRATGGIDPMGKRKNAAPEGSNVSIANRGRINSAFTDGAVAHEVIVYHIGDIKVDVATWMDGDDYAEFDHVAYLKKDEKKLIAWVNKNLSEDDMEY
jgi:hypothetical protein